MDNRKKLEDIEKELLLLEKAQKYLNWILKGAVVLILSMLLFTSCAVQKPKPAIHKP